MLINVDIGWVRSEVLDCLWDLEYNGDGKYYGILKWDGLGECVVVVLMKGDVYF